MQVWHGVRRLGAMVVAAVLALALTACGGTSVTADDTSGEGAAEAGSTSSQLTELSKDEFFASVMGALEDAGSFEYESTQTLGAEGEETTTSLSGVARYEDDGSVAIRMSGEVLGEEATMMLVDKVLYMQMAPLTPDGKWMALDLDDENSLLGSVGELFDPAGALGAMGSPRELDLVGVEDVEGVPTHHYRLTFDAKAVLDSLDLPQGALDGTGSVPDELAMDMWVDADHRPRKFESEVVVPAGGGAGEVTTRQTGVYRNFGVEVDLHAPADDDVVDAPSMPGAA